VKGGAASPRLDRPDANTLTRVTRATWVASVRMIEAAMSKKRWADLISA
jgi:hypothetical protein